MTRSRWKRKGRLVKPVMMILDVLEKAVVFIRNRIAIKKLKKQISLNS
jgi:hypothetical protein